MEGGIDWGFGIDRYTLLYLKQIINKTYCIAQGTLQEKKKKTVKSQIRNIKEWE